MPRDAPTIYIDLETRSVADLRKVGLTRYSRDPTTDLILARFRIDDGPQIEVRRRHPLPAAVVDAMLDPCVIWCAHNYRFEYEMIANCLAPRYGWPAPPSLDRWHCTMAHARSSALPGNLEDALRALDHKIQKDREGHALMLRMCRPRKLTTLIDMGMATDAMRAAEADPMRFTVWGATLIEWWADEERLEKLGAYCGTDVDGGRALDHTLPPMPATERAYWMATEEMNAQGVRFDLGFVDRALEVVAQAKSVLDDEMAEVTGNHVPAASNVAALKRWLMDQGVDLKRPPDPFAEEEGAEDDDDAGADEEGALPEMRRSDIVRLLMLPGLKGTPAHRALTIRLEAGKTSTAKLNAIRSRVDENDRAYGLLAYHGTTTGRDSAAGSGIQAQNFPRDGVEAIYPGCSWDDARLALDGGPEAVEALVGAPLDVISRMLRGAILPDEGEEIISADYSAVELRGVAWLAGQTDLVEGLRSGAKIYEQTAGSIFGVPWKTVKKDSRERWVGKQTVLGCLASDALVLTHRGWVPVCTVEATDCVWDGVEWVRHDGLLDQGLKEVIRWQGVALTADHAILTGHGWREWGVVLADPSLFPSALASAGTAPPSLKSASAPLKLKSQTYDLLNAGPRNRFTILTDAGPVIVHNCGYQMGAWKFWSQCLALGQPIEADLAVRSVRTFREMYPAIPKLWYGMNDAAIDAVKHPTKKVYAADGRILFHYDSNTGWLRMRLPSGRVLRYRNPRVEVDERYQREGVVFWGVNPKTKRWGQRRGFGGFWVENAVQGLCRDLMLEGDRRVTAAGYRPIIRVHDELVRGTKIGQGDKEEVVRLMCILPAWADRFPLSAEAWRGGRYG